MTLEELKARAEAELKYGVNAKWPATVLKLLEIIAVLRIRPLTIGCGPCEQRRQALDRVDELERSL